MGGVAQGLFQVLCKPLSFLIVVGQLARPMEHGQIAISIAMHAHLGLYIVAAVAIRRYLQDQSIETHTVIGAHRALVLLAQDVVEVAAYPWHEGGALFLRRAGKLGVERGHVDLAQVAVGCLHVGDARSSQFERQSPLMEPAARSDRPRASGE